MNTKKLLLLAALFVLLVTSIVAIHYLYRVGNVYITVNTPDQQDLTLKLNQKLLPLSVLNKNYGVAAGTYSLAVSKPGYKSTDTQFRVQKSQTTVINITLQRNNLGTIANWQQVDGSANYPGTSITNVNYFYQNTWAIVVIQTPDGNSGVVVTQYSDTSNVWKIILGPGTSFTATDMQRLPSNVSSYMQNNNYINTGGN